MPGTGLPDWRDAGAYAQLFKAERSAFAWEWLRRDTEYRRAALRLAKSGSAREWHLLRYEDPRRATPLARPIWAAPAYSLVLRARACAGAQPGDMFDLSQMPELATILSSPGIAHVLLSDGFRSLRLDIAGQHCVNSPLRLGFDLAGLRSLEPALLLLRRFRALALTGRFSSVLHPPVQRAMRLVLLLRTFDAMEAGASQFEIADELLSKNFYPERWRVHSPSLRSRAQRLVRTARNLGRGAFWQLLG